MVGSAESLTSLTLVYRACDGSSALPLPAQMNEGQGTAIPLSGAQHNYDLQMRDPSNRLNSSEPPKTLRNQETQSLKASKFSIDLSGMSPLSQFGA